MPIYALNGSGMPIDWISRVAPKSKVLENCGSEGSLPQSMDDRGFGCGGPHLSIGNLIFQTLHPLERVAHSLS